MFGHLELVAILVALGLVIFGPRRMMEMASSIGRVIGQIQQASREFQQSGTLTAPVEEHHGFQETASSVPSMPPPASRTEGNAAE